MKTKTSIAPLSIPLGLALLFVLAATLLSSGQQQVAPVTTPNTANTALRCTLVSAASDNATNCKNAAGNVYGWRFVNTTGTIYYLKMYNTSSSPTSCTSSGFVESIPIPASTSGAGFAFMEPMGEAYSTGISFCLTAGSANNNDASAVTGIFGTILYK